jgi:transposase
VEAELGRLSTCDPWVKQVPFLIQLPGLGMLSVMSILAAIGEITRFPSAKKLVGYAGLGASVHDSGETQETRTYYQRGPTRCAVRDGRSCLGRGRASSSLESPI